MASIVDGIRAGAPWSLSGLFHAFDDVLDEEGRPLGERRASSAAKTGVELELRACPYPDHRRGQPMNVSALKQVMAHWDATVADVEAFQATLDPAIDGWTRMQCAVVDQFSRPALFLLEHPDARVPAPVAVGFKLAAGYFSVVNGLGPSSQPAPGESREAWFAALLERRRALVGASEVCAGPAPLIARATAALLSHPGTPPRGEVTRAARAQLLVVQLRLGLAWKAYDQSLERALLSDPAFAALAPSTSFLAREWTARRQALADVPGEPPLSYISDPWCRARVPGAAEALRGSSSSPAVVAMLVEAMAHQSEAALRSPVALHAELARRIAAWITTYRTLHASVVSLERALRRVSGWPVDAPVAMNGLILASGGCRRWFDALLGHRLEVPVGDDTTVRVASHRREWRVAID